MVIYWVMMCSESLPKEFEKAAEFLPFTKYGLSSAEEFKKAEEDINHHEWLKKAGLTSEEVKLYQDNEVGLLDQCKKIESSVLKTKLEEIYYKINKLQDQTKSSHCDQPSTSEVSENLLQKQHNPIKIYPEGHPMNELINLEKSLFGHISTDIIPITKRRKVLRRLERKKERLLAQKNRLDIGVTSSTSKVDRPGSLWDVKELPPRLKSCTTNSTNNDRNKAFGPKKRTMYTIKDNKIVRLEPIQDRVQEYQAVDIVMPVNAAEAQFLEGTKMCLDDIKNIDRFKDYDPGIPSKVLYLKNIASTVCQEQISLLFNQFVLANGGPVGLKVMTGRMRGQAFVSFQSEDLAIQALDEINGTILGGQPVIAVFGRSTNSIQQDHR